VRSLRGRLVAAIAVVALVSVAVAVTIGAALTRRAVERNTARDVAAQAELLAQMQRDSVRPACTLLGSAARTLERQQQRLECGTDEELSPYLLPEEQAALSAGRPVDGTVTVEGERYFRSARPVKNRRAIVLLRPVSSISSAWRPQLEGLLVGALAAVVLAALAAFVVARAIARPVGRVVHASRRLVTEESPPTLPVEGPTELASLAQSFNDMADQLARAREAERNFLLSVSHELKTPLTAIRGYTEALADEAVTPEEAVEVIAREAERLDRLVHDLLDLARMKRSRFSVRREPVDLASAAREAVRRYAKQAEAFGVELEGVTAESAPATADSDRVLQIVSNLVENALRVTPSGGVVRVVAEPSVLTVEDTGPGLRPDELEHAFERFFLYSRYGGERSVGSGLGLAIVKELAESMGGSVEVRSDPGRVTRFTVRLPHGSLADADAYARALAES
jgi:two-component system, OmpR family, sensor kinase